MTADENIIIRRSNRQDITGILNLHFPQKNVARSIFGRCNLSSLIETSVLSLTIVNNEYHPAKVVGFLCLNDAAPGNLGEDLMYMQHLTETWQTKHPISPRNTLFLTYFARNVVNPPKQQKIDQEEQILFFNPELVMQMVFSTIPFLEYVIFPFNRECDHEIEDEIFCSGGFFQRLSLRESNDTDIGAVNELYEDFRPLVCRKEEFLPVVLVREAKVEDHDDLIPIIQAQNESIVEAFGDFFVADLIESQDTSNKVLIAEINGLASGILAISDELELDTLQECFALNPFNNLIKSSKTENDATEGVAVDIVVFYLGPPLAIDREVFQRKYSVQYLQLEIEHSSEESISRIKASIDDCELNSKGLFVEGVTIDVLDLCMKEANLVPGALIVSKELHGSVLENFGNIKIYIFEHSNLQQIFDEEIIRPKMPACNTGAQGENNVFMISLFCIDKEFENLGKEFLFQAFQSFPDKDYCILTIPPQAQDPSFLKFFTTVPAIPGSHYSHVLYLLHRSAWLLLSNTSNLKLVVDRYIPTSESNNKCLIPLLTNLEDASQMLTDLESFEEENDISLNDNPNGVSFSLTAVPKIQSKKQNEVDVSTTNIFIGFACVVRIFDGKETADYLSELKESFDIECFIQKEDYRNRDIAIISHFVLNPNFLPLARTFMKEIMRQFKKTCFLTILRPSFKFPSILPVIDEFVQVRPRRPIEPTPRDNSFQNDPAPQSKFALFFISKRLINEPKIFVNSRIVIVGGGSDCGLSLIEELLLVPYLRFTNIYVISPEGFNIAFEASCVDSISSFSYPNRCNLLNVSFLAQLGLSFVASCNSHGIYGKRLELIMSKVVDLDREGKAVVLQDGDFVPYDYLILTSGAVNTLSCIPKQILNTSDFCRRFDKKDTGIITNGIICHNGNLANSNLVYEELLNENCRSSSCIVVYGDTFNVYSLLEPLLQLNIESSRITLLLTSSNPYSDNNHINSSIDITLTTDFNFTIIKDALISDVKIDANSQKLCEIMYSKNLGEAKDEEMILSCDLLISVGKNDVQEDIFYAINESGLVYDGRLVVNSKFRTTDKSIYAGGSIARFSRRYDQSLLHENYNSRECGKLLAASLLEVLDPLACSIDVIDSTKPKLNPSFVLPTVKFAILPGQLHYVSITLPKMPKDFSSLETNYEGRFCCLSFDTFGKLCQFTYYGKDPVEIRNFSCLVGLHESLLNSAISSFENKLFDDWIDFFRLDWAKALYHDRFLDFYSNLSSSLEHNEDFREFVMDYIAKAKDEKSNGRDSDEDEKKLTVKSAVGRGGANLIPSTKRLIEGQLMEFLSKNREILSMYHLPKQKRK